MVKYSRKPAEPAKSKFFLFISAIAASSRVDDLRAHFKNTFETARAVKGMKLTKAIRYMENVLEHK